MSRPVEFWSVRAPGVDFQGKMGGLWSQLSPSHSCPLSEGPGLPCALCKMPRGNGCRHFIGARGASQGKDVLNKHTFEKGSVFRADLGGKEKHVSGLSALFLHCWSLVVPRV